MGVTSRWTRFKDAFAPWAGLAAGTVGAGFAHQTGSDGVFDECASSPGLVLVVCFIGIAITAAGAFASWGVYRTDTEGPARRLIATVSLGTAALLVLAMILPIIASLVIAPCYG
jgi:hypothetical protein